MSAGSNGPARQTSVPSAPTVGRRRPRAINPTPAAAAAAQTCPLSRVCSPAPSASSAGSASPSGMRCADTRRLRMPYLPPGKTSTLADPAPRPQCANTPRRGISPGTKTSSPSSTTSHDTGFAAGPAGTCRGATQRDAPGGIAVRAQPWTIAVEFAAKYNLLLSCHRGGSMFDPDRLPELKSLVREATKGDSGLLDEVMRDVALIRPVTTIQPRNINSISLVASDGGNNRLDFNPFSLQVVRVVDTFGDELFLDVISPTTETVALGQRHLDRDTPLGKLMRDLGVSRLADLSPMIPEKNKSRSWPLVYRDLCEWAVLYDLICHQKWGSDTLIIRDGLLRTKIFAGDGTRQEPLFIKLYNLFKEAIERTRRERYRDIF